MQDTFIKFLTKWIYTYRFLIFVIIPPIALFYNAFFPLFWQHLIWNLFLFCIILSTFLIWYITVKKLPINKKNKIWIVIWLVWENNEQKNKLKKDFINELKKDLKKANNYNLPFEVLELKEYVSSEILDSENRKDYIAKINKTIKWHLFIYWDIKERKDWWKDKYYINFSYLIFHKNIPKQTQDRLQKNINANSIIWHFDKWEEVKWFRVTSDLVSFWVKYLIWIASLIHWEVTFSYIIHSNILKSEIKKIRNNVNYIYILRELKGIITEECLIICNALLKEGYIDNWKIFIERIIELWIDKYSGFLLRAIYEFKLWDIEQSLKTLTKAKNEQTSNKDWAWRFSKCFLLLWKENYVQFNIEKKLLIKNCKKIDFSNDFIDNIILFCDNELKATPNKYQIYFWAGFVLYNFKGNLPLSLEYFEKFKENISDEHILKDENDKYIRDIKNKININ
jgi:hypothetical protein